VRGFGRTTETAAEHGGGTQGGGRNKKFWGVFCQRGGVQQKSQRVAIFIREGEGLPVSFRNASEKGSITRGKAERTPRLGGWGAYCVPHRGQKRGEPAKRGKAVEHKEACRHVKAGEVHPNRGPPAVLTRETGKTISGGISKGGPDQEPTEKDKKSWVDHSTGR